MSLNISIGGGSASDSGHSIASSVSTEPFFSGQSVATETQAIVETNATQTQTPAPASSAPIQTTFQSQMDSATNASVNNNELAPQNVIEPTTSQVADTQPDDTIESLNTIESKDHEIVSNDDIADNNDVINIYSSGDEGLYK